MNAARRLISGEGELEKEWKRLFGIKSGLSEACEAGTYFEFAELCSAGVDCPKVETDRFPKP
jgi:hypothetical protein